VDKQGKEMNGLQLLFLVPFVAFTGMSALFAFACAPALVFSIVHRDFSAFLGVALYTLVSGAISGFLAIPCYFLGVWA
jgi:hypothetical protein